MMRTTRSTIVFKRPFKLGADGVTYCAGSYLIEVDEELLQNVPFPAYRRTTTAMKRINEQSPTRRMPTVIIDPLMLELAILKDNT